jgi:hypothetical protein
MGQRQRYRAVVAWGLLAAGVAVTLLLSPEDRVLGPRTKLVFLHGALILASLLLYGAAGVAALVYLFSRNDRAYRAAAGIWTAAVAANAASLPTGLYAAKVIWGGFFWHEPRVLANAVMLLLSLAIAGVALLSANRRGMALLYAGAAGLFLALIRQAGRIMHPVNPIGSSDSWALKLSFLTLLLLVLGLAVEAVRPGLHPGRR